MKLSELKARIDLDRLQTRAYFLWENNSNCFNAWFKAEFEELKLLLEPYDKQIHSALGVVYSNYGRGGSGVFIEYPKGSISLLTAKHVVTAALRSGVITVGNIQENIKSIEPSSIRIDNRFDAALLTMPENFSQQAFIKHSEIQRAEMKIEPGDLAVFSGVVGEWREDINLRQNTIGKEKFINYWTEIEEISENRQSIFLEINKDDAMLPSSFKGMSGGPLFIIRDDKLLLTGIAIEEHNTTFRQVKCQPISVLQNLLEPFESPASINDYMGDSGEYHFDAQWQREGYGQKFQAKVLFERYISNSNPEQDMGRIARITALFVDLNNGSLNYPINVESVFEYYSDDFNHFKNAMDGELFLTIGTEIEPLVVSQSS